MQTSPTTTVNAGRMFGIRRASAEASFPPILSVVSVNVEKRIAMKTQVSGQHFQRVRFCPLPLLIVVATGESRFLATSQHHRELAAPTQPR